MPFGLSSLVTYCDLFAGGPTTRQKEVVVVFPSRHGQPFPDAGTVRREQRL